MHGLSKCARLLALPFLLTGLAIPELAAAQAGRTLGRPSEGRPSEGRPSEVVVVPYQAPAPRDSVGAASETSSDPELVRLRAPERSRMATRRARLRGPGFAESWGHAWAGLGIGAAAGGTVGFAIGAPLFAGFGDDGWLFGGGAFALLVSPVTAPLGAALGAWGWGQVAGGNGSFWASFGLSYAGGGLGAGLAALLLHATQDAGLSATFGAVAGALLSTLGAAAGYQLSQRSERASRAGSGPVIAPTLAPTADGAGATVGAAGLF